MSEISFFRPSSLTILYALFAHHHHLYPNEKRICVPPPQGSDVYQYMQRMNFFESCPDFEAYRQEDFTRHPSQGTFVPITCVKTEEESSRHISEIVRMIFSGHEKKAGVLEVEYSFLELVGNSIEHSKSPIGCLVQAQLYRERYLYGVILDTGIGIKSHLRNNQNIASQIVSDEVAIEMALRPGISGTHNRKTGDLERTDIEMRSRHAGLGLSVCSALTIKSGGYMHIISGNAGHMMSKDGVAKDKIGGWPGTAIFFNIDCQNISSVPTIIKDIQGTGLDKRTHRLKIEKRS